MAEWSTVVKKPAAKNLPPVIDTIFDRSMAISNAVSQFWEQGLAKRAELGDVKEFNDRYEITIVYQIK